MQMPGNILVVEDEVIVAMSIGSVLEDYGYAVAGVVASAEEAVQAVRCDPPDLVLMDINLAGALDGIEAARLMMAECRVPVVYVTAQMDRGTRERALAIGPAGFLTKPFTAEKLAQVVSDALLRSRS